MKYFGHRGASKIFGDNNLESYRQAVESGAIGTEMYIGITKDGVLIMHHKAVDKTTGIPVYDRNYLEGSDLKLLQVLEEFSRDDLEYVLDIKNPSVYSSSCRNVYEMCDSHKCLHWCVFAYFNEFNLRDLLNIETVIRRPIQKVYITSNLNEDMVASVIKRDGLSHIIPYKFQINNEVTRFVNSENVKVYAYTCNTQGLCTHMGALGVDGIIIDLPGFFFISFNDEKNDKKRNHQRCGNPSVILTK